MTPTRPALDPTQLADWQIAEAAEPFLKPIAQVAAEMGLRDEEVILFGRQIAKIDHAAVMSRLGSRPPQLAGELRCPASRQPLRQQMRFEPFESSLLPRPERRGRARRYLEARFGPELGRHPSVVFIHVHAFL